MRKTKPTVKPTRASKTWKQKEAVTLSYVEWFVRHQSGDAKLAKTLARRWRKGWNLALRHFRQGGTSAGAAQQLRRQGYNVILLEEGLSQFELPGRTVTFLVLNREKCCQQITLEKWTASAGKTTNVVLIGMGQKDVWQTTVAEKQIHLCAFELPRAGDYLSITTQSISPLLKGVLVFAGVTLLAGCTKKEDSQTAAPAPVNPPTIPTDPTGDPGPHKVTSDDPAELPDPGMVLPTGRRNGHSTNQPHKKPGVITNIAPGTPVDQWYWFWLFTVNVATFKKGCCFYVESKRKVWINGTDVPMGEKGDWHDDTPLPGNIIVDSKGLTLIDNPGYPPKAPNPPPYDDGLGLGDVLRASDHLISTWFFRLVVWCPGEDAQVYTYSKTVEIDKGVVKNSSEKPKPADKHAVTADDLKKGKCP